MKVRMKVAATVEEAVPAVVAVVMAVVKVVKALLALVDAAVEVIL